MRLSEIIWGQDSAENDPNLLQYFQDSEAFARLQQRRKQIVVGRKGSGKSALRAKLAQEFSREPGTTVITISPTFQAIRSILNEPDLHQNFGSEIFFQHTWLRQILLDCLAAVGHDVKGDYAKDSFEFARTVATQLNRTSKDILENITDILTRVKAKVGDLGEFGVHLERELRNVAEVDALEHHTLEIANGGKRFLILVDDLDQGWDNSPLANHMLLGLLRAASVLNGKSNNIFPIVFLREDVYGLLMPLTQHADKYRDIESIKWEKAQLMQVLNARINFNRMSAHSLPALQDALYSVFPQTVGTTNTDNWLVERTLSRPRELIQLSRIYTESVTGDQPDDQSLKNAEAGYSNWKLADLCSEFANQYPGLLEFFQAWKSRYYRNNYHLRRAELEDMILTLLATSNINQQWFNQIVEQTNTQRMIEILYEIGLLGDYIAGGAGGGTRTYYSYMGPHQPRFDEVQIHHCFRKALDTVERNRGT